MLHFVVVLLVIGVLALLFELLLPGVDGFVGGFVGLLSLAASAVLAVIFTDHGWIFVLINLGTILLSGAVLFTFIRKRQLHGKIVLNENLAESLPEYNLSEFIGKEGLTMTVLRPYGEVDFNGVRMEVTSGGELLEKGIKVRVAEVSANRLLVSPVLAN